MLRQLTRSQSVILRNFFAKRNFSKSTDERKDSNLTNVFERAKAAFNIGDKKTSSSKNVSPMSLSTIVEEKSPVEKSDKLTIKSKIESPTFDSPFAEFFDEKSNWGKDMVIVGRSWRLNELRIKRNSDLHKLWFILLKERNMLLTMEAACLAIEEATPTWERYYKLLESMDNIETVISERNVAFLELETGETGERPSKMVTTRLGYRQRKYLSEHPDPPGPNDKEYETPYLDDDCRTFQKMMKEKEILHKRNLEDDRKRDAGLHKMVHYK